MNCPLPNGVIEELLGAPILCVAEIRGGISKRVYRIAARAETYILYIWLPPYGGRLTENRTEGADYLFADGFEYFIYNAQLLRGIGVRVPGIIASGHWDEGGFDYALVERFKGISLNEYMQNGGDVSLFAEKIADVAGRMSAQTRAFYGPPIETRPSDVSAPQLVLNFYREEVNIASAFDKEIGDLKQGILSLMQRQFSKTGNAHNRSYGLIHGELTPPHIFLFDDGEIGLIDIEGLKYFDVEYEWAVIDSMYGGKVPLPDTIDIQKMAFYKLCLKIGYLSAAADYLANVDANDEFFINLRESSLADIRGLL